MASFGKMRISLYYHLTQLMHASNSYWCLSETSFPTIKHVLKKTNRDKLRKKKSDVNLKVATISFLVDLSSS